MHEVYRLAIGKPSGAHCSSTDEDGRNIYAHRGHQHAGHNLVAVRNAEHAVKTMRLQNGLNRIGDDLSRRKAVFHSDVSHCNPVIYANGVELERNAPGFANRVLGDASKLLQMPMTRDDVDVGVA